MIKPLIAVVALAVLAAAPAVRADGAVDEALWGWLQANGAALNFLPKTSEGGVRGGVAVATIPKGGLVASIPMKLALRFPAHYDTFPVRGAARGHRGARTRPALHAAAQRRAACNRTDRALTGMPLRTQPKPAGAWQAAGPRGPEARHPLPRLPRLPAFPQGRPPHPGLGVLPARVPARAH